MSAVAVAMDRSERWIRECVEDRAAEHDLSLDRIEIGEETDTGTPVRLILEDAETEAEQVGSQIQYVPEMPQEKSRFRNRVLDAIRALRRYADGDESVTQSETTSTDEQQDGARDDDTEASASAEHPTGVSESPDDVATGDAESPSQTVEVSVTIDDESMAEIRSLGTQLGDQAALREEIETLQSQVTELENRLETLEATLAAVGESSPPDSQSS